MEDNMNFLKFRTKRNTDPQGKPRVFFTCHPADFAKYFEKISNDILDVLDCTIYYTENMADGLRDEDQTAIYQQMNLFVIPITYRLLQTHSRAMDVDFTFAKEKHIPTLAILMEPGLNQLYSQNEIFGDLQYLDSFSQEITGTSYDVKLRRFLDSVLTADDEAKRVRAAFDAYIFLSYRKKDRKYATKLMQLIHSNPLCRDIAIWYDEFLMPGEHFNNAIQEALRKSDLFTLLVTPNLVNEPNYVQAVEYPAAREANKVILPAEMVSTDNSVLKKQFVDIPDCVDVSDENAFRASLNESVNHLTLQKNDTDPAHDYLIGLAYLNGIDVEVDRNRALNLITEAAEKGLPEAMEKLYNIYRFGLGVNADYWYALKWSESLYEYYCKEYGAAHQKTLAARELVAKSKSDVGLYEEAISIYKSIYDTRIKTQSRMSLDSLNDLHYIAELYANLGEWEKYFESMKTIYELSYKTFGDRNPVTVSALIDYSISTAKYGNIMGALTVKDEYELLENTFSLACEEYGEEHALTVSVMTCLVEVYCKAGDGKKALDFATKVFHINNKTKGETDIATINSISLMGDAYGEIGNHDKALELYKKALALYRDVVFEIVDFDCLDKQSPVVIQLFCHVAAEYYRIKDYDDSLDYYERAYKCKINYLGEKHVDTITTICDIAKCHYNLGDRKKALEYYDKAYQLSYKNLGPKNRITLGAKSGLAYTYAGLGNNTFSLKLMEEVYEVQSIILCEGHPDTLITIDRLINAYRNTGANQKALALCEQAYSLRYKVLGKQHTETISTLNTLNYLRSIC